MSKSNATKMKLVLFSGPSLQWFPCFLPVPPLPPKKQHAKFQRYLPLMRGEERAVKFLFSLLPNFFGRFSLLPDFSPFSLISLLRGLFYLLLHRSASFPRVLKEGKHTKHVCHVDISRSSHTTFRFCHVSLKL